LLDYLDCDSLLSEEELRIRDLVRRFADEECMPIIARHFDEGSFPMGLIPRMAELGLFGVHVEGYGCRKLSDTMYGLICRELGRCDSGIRAMFSVQNSLVMYPIFTFGSDAQRGRWLPGMARGEVIGCFGLSEPGFGSDPSGMIMRAERDGKGYRLTGEKMWITNGSIAQVALIWARTEEGIGGFLVEAGTPGFREREIRRKFAYRTSPTAILEFDGCRVGSESRLPGVEGFKSIFQCLNHARFGVACSALGSAMSCYRSARDFAAKRVVFGKPAASCQLIQERLVRMAVEITKAQLLNYHVGRLMDQGRARHGQISMAKLNSVREAMKAARDARDILGARGILADNQVIRHLCDLEAMSTLEGTENIHILILGQDLTGMSAF
jgi:glutaryl-CoA dehydrogenase